MATRRGFAFAVLALLGASVATSAEPACHTMLSGIKTLDFLSTFAEAVDKAGLTRAFTGQGAAQKSVVLVPTDGVSEQGDYPPCTGCFEAYLPSNKLVSESSNTKHWTRRSCKYSARYSYMRLITNHTYHDDISLPDRRCRA